MGAGAAAGTAGTAGAVDTSVMGAGAAPTAGSTGAGSGAFLGEGVSSGIPAWDGALAGATEAGAGAAGAASYQNTSSVFNAAKDSQLANEWMAANGMDASAGYTAGAAGYASGSLTAPVVANGLPNGTGSGINTIPGGSGSGSGTGIGGSGVTLGDLAKIAGAVAGIAAANDATKSQKEAANNMLEWLKQRMAMTDNLYAPGSPEYNALWDEMSRKDAAAGRNSQYGPRSVDLAARIAQIKSDANVRMTTGVGQWMNGAFNQNASADSGMWAALGNILGNQGLLDLISKL
jgi:hypothetical protein